jgi:hypothetical protein
MKQRFFKLSAILMKRSDNLTAHRDSFFEKLKAKYAQKQLIHTVKKMQLWALKIDTKYFKEIDQQTLLAFTKESETFVYLLKMMYKRELESINNPLIQAFREKHQTLSLHILLETYAKGGNVFEVESIWKDEKQVIGKIEASLRDFLSKMKPDQYSQSEIIEFYENISLRKNVWSSMLSCQKMMEKLDFKVLERNRF